MRLFTSEQPKISFAVISECLSALRYLFDHGFIRFYFESFIEKTNFRCSVGY